MVDVAVDGIVFLLPNYNMDNVQEISLITTWHYRVLSRLKRNISTGN